MKWRDFFFRARLLPCRALESLQELQQMFMLDESVQAIFGTTHYLASVAQLVAGDDDYKPDRRLMQVRERRFGDSTANESGTTEYLVHFDGWSDRCDQQLYFC